MQTKAIDNRFSKLANQWMQDKKLSQEQVAIALGTERSYVSRMERGIILPSINVLILLGEMYGVPASTLLLRTEQALSNHVSPQE